MEALRLAVVGTPRSGNTWVRHLLASAYKIPSIARHSLNDADWAALPSDVVLQLHWRREPNFAAKLTEQGFRVVTVARHPLDVLISILHFCIYESESEHWLVGAGGSESSIFAAMPRSRPFIEYGKGARAAELLSVTADWWGQPGVVCLRYEDCVRDALSEMHRIQQTIAPFRCDSIGTVVESCSLGQLRKGATNNHFWKGSPGLWRQLLPMAEAMEIAQAHSSVMAHLGYKCAPDTLLDVATADRNWIALVGDEVKQTLQRNTEGHRAQIKEKQDRISELERHEADLEKRLNESVTISGRIPRVIKRIWHRHKWRNSA